MEEGNGVLLDEVIDCTLMLVHNKLSIRPLFVLFITGNRL